MRIDVALDRWNGSTFVRDPVVLSVTCDTANARRIVGVIVNIVAQLTVIDHDDRLVFSGSAVPAPIMTRLREVAQKSGRVAL